VRSKTIRRKFRNLKPMTTLFDDVNKKKESKIVMPFQWGGKAILIPRKKKSTGSVLGITKMGRQA